MYELKKVGKVFASKFVRTGPSSFEKRIYRPAVTQRLRNTDLDYFQRKMQLSVVYAYPDGLPSQLIRLSGVLHVFDAAFVDSPQGRVQIDSILLLL